MTETRSAARRWRLAAALVLVASLAACGVDGEPEQPTRGVLAPAAVLPPPQS